MLKKDFVDENPPSEGLQVRPMRKDDAYEMIGMTGMGIGQDIDSLRAQYEMHIGNSFVARVGNEKMVGFILAERHPTEFPNGLGITNLVVDPHQKNAGECTTLLVSAMAHHCINHGQNNMDLVVFNNDSNSLEICRQYAARKRDSHKAVGNDGCNFIADFYTIDDLAGKFGPSRHNGPKPKL